MGGAATGAGENVGTVVPTLPMPKIPLEQLKAHCEFCRKITRLFPNVEWEKNQRTGHLVWPGQKVRGN